MDLYDTLEMYINEIFKKVIRGGKIKRKVICPDIMKAKDGKCVLMSPAERKKREIAAKKTGKKLKSNIGKQLKANKKRAKSLRKRAMRIPDIGADNVKTTGDE